MFLLCFYMRAAKHIKCVMNVLMFVNEGFNAVIVVDSVSFIDVFLVKSINRERLVIWHEET